MATTLSRGAPFIVDTIRTRGGPGPLWGHHGGRPARPCRTAPAPVSGPPGRPPSRGLAQTTRREQGVQVARALQAAPVGPHRQHGGGRLTAHLVRDAPSEPAPEAPAAVCP